jgi:hypothetical protein
MPSVSLHPKTLSVLIAREEMLARALNGNPHLQQLRIIFITGIRSGVLSLLDRGSDRADSKEGFYLRPAQDHPGGDEQTAEKWAKLNWKWHRRSG